MIRSLFAHFVHTPVVSPPMGVPRRRSTAIASLLFATIAFTAVVAESQRHDLLEDLSSARGSIPAFAAEHEQPDHTLHIEAVRRTEPDSCFGCIGCLPQQRQLAVGAFAPVLGDFEPDASAVATESLGGLGADARRLKPSRAPPRA